LGGVEMKQPSMLKRIVTIVLTVILIFPQQLSLAAETSHSDLIKDDLFWNNGVIIERDNTIAMILSDSLNRSIHIKINGNRIVELLEIIRREIDHIHKTLNSPNVLELIPCNCEECRTSSNIHFHDYKNVLIAESKGISAVQCQKSFQHIEIQKLLHNYRHSNYSSRIKEQNNFISDIINIKLNTMEIQNLNIEDSQVNFADKINSIRYRENLSKTQFTELKNILLSTNDTNKDFIIKTIAKYNKEESTKERNTIQMNLEEFLEQNVLPIGYSAAGSAIFEMIKSAF
jgi:hypothetical protein